MLHAETLGIGSAKLPNLPEDVIEPFARLHERITKVRGLIETIDLLYAAFAKVRTSREWAGDVLPRMQRWLQQGAERQAA